MLRCEEKLEATLEAGRGPHAAWGSPSASFSAGGW